MYDSKNKNNTKSNIGPENNKPHHFKPHGYIY